MLNQVQSNLKLYRVVCRLILTTALVSTAVGCAVNPVTGNRELALVSTAQEVQIGEQQYAPMRQMSGGDYAVDPKINAYVSSVGNRITAKSDRPLPYEFVVINDSTPNAWALPGGKIAVHRGLLTELGSEAELAAVLGHEVVHAAARHSAKSMQRGMLFQGVAVAAAVTANSSDYGSLVMTATGMGLQLINQKYGRDAERESDEYGMLYMSRAGYDPAAAVDLQKTFVRLSEGRNSNWLTGLFASHPPSMERVTNNEATLARMKSGGEINAGGYRNAMAPLMASKAAYAAHDRGRKALAKNDTDSALTAAVEALRIEPRESQFHALRGDIRAVQGRWKDALTNYNRAVNYNGKYFYPLMRRGLTQKQLKNSTAAVADLERSIKLLPTAPAMNALGEMRLAAGQRDDAISLFRSAAKSDSPSGRAAADSLIRLELSDKPHLYIKSAIGLDSSGRMQMEISNPTSVNVQISQLLFQYKDADGQIFETRRSMSQRIDAGEAVRFAIDANLVGNTNDPRRVRAGVVGASIIE